MVNKLSEIKLAYNDYIKHNKQFFKKSYIQNKIIEFKNYK